MKKLLLLSATIFIIFAMTTAYARPVLQCPHCGNGELISINEGPWEKKSGGTFVSSETWEERTITIKCTCATHVYKQKRNYQVTPKVQLMGPLF